MPPYRLPRHLLYGALQRGQRSVGVRRRASPFTSKTHLRSAAYHLIDWKLSLQTERVGAIRANKGYLPSATTTLLMLKIDVLAHTQRLYPHPVLPVTSVTESVRQTLGFASIFETTLIRLPAQRPRRNRRTTSRQGKARHSSCIPRLLALSYHPILWITTSIQMTHRSFSLPAHLISNPV